MAAHKIHLHLFLHRAACVKVNCPNCKLFEREHESLNVCMCVGLATESPLCCPCPRRWGDRPPCVRRQASPA